MENVSCVAIRLLTFADVLDTAVEERAAARVPEVDSSAVEEAGCLAAAARDVGACDAPVGVHERLRLEPHAASPCAHASGDAHQHVRAVLTHAEGRNAAVEAWQLDPDEAAHLVAVRASSIVILSASS